MSKNTGEEILFRTRPSRFRYFWKYAGAVFLFVLAALFWLDIINPLSDLAISLPSSLNPIYGYSLEFWTIAGCGVIALLLIFKAELDRIRIRYEISNYRVFKISGIFRKETISIPFQKLERCDVVQSSIGRLLNIGDVRVDTGEDHFLMEGVPKPKEIDDLIFKEGIRKQS